MIRPTESILVTSSYVNVPPTETFSPTCKLPAIPTPPVTFKAPVVVEVDAVLSVILTAPANVLAPEPKVVIPEILILLVLILSVAATPVRLDPSP